MESMDTQSVLQCLLNINASTVLWKLYKERMAKFPFSLSDYINKTPIFIKLQPPLRQSTVHGSPLHSSINPLSDSHINMSCDLVQLFCAVMNHKKKVICYDDNCRNRTKAKYNFFACQIKYIKGSSQKQRTTHSESNISTRLWNMS